MACDNAIKYVTSNILYHTGFVLNIFFFKWVFLKYGKDRRKQLLKNVAVLVVFVLEDKMYIVN